MSNESTENLPAAISKDESHHHTEQDIPGGYSDAERVLIYRLALHLKGRDAVHRPAENVSRPRNYMSMYVKAAAALYELAKQLNTFNRNKARVFYVKTVREWLTALSGFDLPCEGIPDHVAPFVIGEGLSETDHD